MIGRLLNRWREGKAAQTIEGALRGAKPPAEAIAAIRELGECGSRASVQVLCLAFTHGPEALRAEAPAALAAVHQREPDERILKALNEAVLSEQQSPAVRQAAIAALAQVVDARRAGGLVELLKSGRTPLPVRTAAVQALKQLHYAELVERLVENFLRSRQVDPRGVMHQWVVEQLKALDDREKLTKLNEIAHVRRKLRYYAVNLDTTDPAAIVHLMAEVDPGEAKRFLSQMADESTRVISAAAIEALQDIRKRQQEADTQAASQEHRTPPRGQRPPPALPAQPSRT
ncbi:MAG TPA: HEAT repeat domain-containing protein [Planctomycetota bacterium]|nr:HEAT repeat domain-containing protein [Planctomycetota bacterium]HRR79482.1 HEAT repeat domain-containing protein [Planctomycetota bacterium]HRT93324.1 HEAT repeat domain-containing protein [Planctomycetota bacterium]